MVSRRDRGRAALLSFRMGSAILATAAVIAWSPVRRVDTPDSAPIGGRLSAPAALHFEANLGQFDARARYVARVRGGALVLSDEGATLTLGARQTPVTFAVAGGRLVAPRGDNLLETRTNYFVGERARWRTNVPNFRQVTYASVRDGIDVVYHGEAGALEYDVIVAPQADPAAVVIDVGGSEGLAITPDGDLAIQTSRGPVLQGAPRVYQTIHGRREAIHGAYRITGKSSIGVSLGFWSLDLFKI